MARITRWSNVFEVQREQARLSNNEDWNDKHFWNEFIRLRREFFSTQRISDDAPELERRELARSFTEWIKRSGGWWGGDWVDSSGIADWHVNQYVRKVKAGRIPNGKEGKAMKAPPGRHPIGILCARQDKDRLFRGRDTEDSVARVYNPMQPVLDKASCSILEGRVTDPKPAGQMTLIEDKLERVALKFENEKGWRPIQHFIAIAAGLSKGSGYAQMAPPQDARALSSRDLQEFREYALKRGISEEEFSDSKYNESASSFWKQVIDTYLDSPKADNPAI